LLAHADFLKPMRVFPLWTVAISLAVGAVVAIFAGRKRWESGSFNFIDEDNSPIWVVLILIVVGLGAAVRYYGLEFGFPNNFHPDEVPKINAIERMKDAGDLNPRYFLHPSLLLYSTYAMNWLVQSIGPELPWRLSTFFAGRLVSALAGVISIYLLYGIGTRLYNRRVGLGAAFLLAIFPLHVTCSRYLKEDALLTCIFLATVLLALKAVQEQRRSLILLCGFCAGVACSTKYTGLLCVAVVCSIPWLKSRRLLPDISYLKWTVAALLIVPLAFVLITPYALLDYPKFIKDFGSEKYHAIRGHTITIDAWSQFWTYHVWNSILPGMTPLAALVSFAGLGVLIWRRRVEDLYVIALFLLFYLPAEWVKSKPAPQPERYILPCLPFLAIAGAEFVRVLANLRFALLAPVFACALALPPLVRTVHLASEINDDTRDRMTRWMIDHLPHGSKVFLDWKRYAPAFWHDEFEVEYIPRAEIGTRLTIRALKESGFDYMVLSSLFYDRYFSQPNPDGAMREYFRDVFREVPIILQMRPRYGTYGFHNPTLTLFSLKPEDFAALEAKRELGAGDAEQQYSWR
jgi:hypothetical protein